MRKTLATLAVLVAAAAFRVTPAAHAVEYDYRGRCGFTTLQRDVLSGDTWVGEIEVVVVASGPWPLYAPKPTVAVTDVSCELVVNGESRGTVLTAPDGVGLAAAAGTLTYEATEADYVDVCTHATVGGTPISHCAEACTCDLPPAEVNALPGAVQDELNETVFEPTDPLTCEALRALAAANDAAPDVLHVDPDTGDTYLFGALLWDCPPYGP